MTALRPFAAIDYVLINAGLVTRRMTGSGKYWMTTADARNREFTELSAADVVKDPLQETAESG